MPTRRRACPACHETIYVRDGKLVTQEQADECDILEYWGDALPGVTHEVIAARREKLSAQGQPAAFRDVIWSIMNES